MYLWFVYFTLTLCHYRAFPLPQMMITLKHIKIVKKHGATHEVPSVV